MNHVTVRMAALAALSAMLLGCATTASVKDATVLSDSGQKGKDENSAASRPMGAPTNIDGAIKQAQAQRKTGIFGCARTLSQLVLLAPDDARVLGEYGKTLIAMGRSDDALAFLERAVELQPKDWSLFSAQGVAYDQKGEYLAAQKAYDRALLLKPGDPTVLSNAALSHMQTGDLDGAERLLMQASPFAAEFPRIASNLALVRSLKTSRPSQTPSVAPPKGPAPVASPAPAAAPSAPVAPVAILPILEPGTSESSMAPPPTSVTEMPASPTGDVAAMASALERLRMDPSVYVQPSPSGVPQTWPSLSQPPAVRARPAKCQRGNLSCRCVPLRTTTKRARVRPRSAPRKTRHRRPRSTGARKPPSPWRCARPWPILRPRSKPAPGAENPRIRRAAPSLTSPGP